MDGSSPFSPDRPIVLEDHEKSPKLESLLD